MCVLPVDLRRLKPVFEMYLYFESLNAGTLYEKVQKEPTSVLFPAGFLLIWAISMIWARMKDKVTMQTPEVEPLLDNEPHAEHYYQIIVRVTIDFMLPPGNIKLRVLTPPRDRILCRIFEHTHERNRTPNHCLYRPNNKCWDNVRRSIAPSWHLRHHRCAHFENKIRYTCKTMRPSLSTCLDCIGHSNGLSRNSVRAYVLGTAKQIGRVPTVIVFD